MGSSASPEERAKTRELAAAIVRSVVDKYPMAHGLFVQIVGDEQRRMYLAANVESLVMALSQEIVALTNEKQAFCRAFQVVDVPKESE